MPLKNSIRSDVRGDLRNMVRHGANATHKSSGFGMPCANCRLYYPADLDTCPACNSKERVSPTAVVAAAPFGFQPPPLTRSHYYRAGRELVEQEREEFLKQFKSQLLVAHAEVANAPTVCALGEHQGETPEAATICKPCYERLQERVDVFEAALHIDLKEAAQIIYDAVWADPSDPSKTYTNAASALITDLRRRSGVSFSFNPWATNGWNSSIRRQNRCQQSPLCPQFRMVARSRAYALPCDSQGDFTPSPDHANAILAEGFSSEMPAAQSSDDTATTQR